jgi:hypothetical protein
MKTEGGRKHQHKHVVCPFHPSSFRLHPLTRVRMLMAGLLVIWLLGAALLISLLLPGCAAREQVLVVPVPCELEDIDVGKCLVATYEGGKP